MSEWTNIISLRSTDRFFFDEMNYFVLCEVGTDILCNLDKFQPAKAK
jgi:hypothetical protein